MTVRDNSMERLIRPPKAAKIAKAGSELGFASWCRSVRHALVLQSTEWGSLVIVESSFLLCFVLPVHGKGCILTGVQNMLVSLFEYAWTLTYREAEGKRCGRSVFHHDLHIVQVLVAGVLGMDGHSIVRSSKRLWQRTNYGQVTAFFTKNRPHRSYRFCPVSGNPGAQRSPKARLADKSAAKAA